MVGVWKLILPKKDRTATSPVIAAHTEKYKMAQVILMPVDDPSNAPNTSRNVT